jgi:hypothetical protein
VTDIAMLLFALTPTTRRRLSPVPTSKLESVVWNGGSDTSPDDDCELLNAIPVAAVVDVALVADVVAVVVLEVAVEVVVDVGSIQCTL